MKIVIAINKWNSNTTISGKVTKLKKKISNNEGYWREDKMDMGNKGPLVRLGNEGQERNGNEGRKNVIPCLWVYEPETLIPRGKIEKTNGDKSFLFFIILYKGHLYTINPNYK